MSDAPQDDPQAGLYRELIDAFVRSCREGAGQLSAQRIRDGVWHPGASQRSLPTEHAMNVLLQCLTPSQRATLAQAVAERFVGGVFDAIAQLSWEDLEPFDGAYEGDPFNDFIGRLSGDWPWPEEEARTLDPPASDRQPDASEDHLYRRLVDLFVELFSEERGSTDRLRAGEWHATATPATDPAAHAMNVLLVSLSPSQRETLVDVLGREYRAGVSEVLVQLSHRGIKPFNAAYEGAPPDDLVRRLGGWQWPPRERLRA